MSQLQIRGVVKTLHYKPNAERLRRIAIIRTHASARIGREPFCGCEMVIYAETSDPIFSPVKTLRMFPRWFRLKMMMGRLLSLQSEMAVESITFRPRFNTSI